jgi:hypothetical protein
MPKKRQQTTCVRSIMNDNHTQLSPQDHLILARIVTACHERVKKDRIVCRQIGLDWLAFITDKKKRGDPRIQTGAKHYGLDPDSLRRHARLVEMWDELPEADEWAKQKKFANPYEFEPQATIILVNAFRAARAARADAKPAPVIRLVQTDKPKVDFYTGAAEVILPTLDLRAHCSISSPPYWRLRDWGPGALGMEDSIEEYISNTVGVYRALRRVMRPDGVVWVIIGDRYTGRARPDASTHGRFVYQPRPATPEDVIPLGNLCLIPQRLTIALQQDGWVVRSVIAWDKVRQVSTGVRTRPLAVHC